LIDPRVDAPEMRAVGALVGILDYEGRMKNCHIIGGRIEGKENVGASHPIQRGSFSGCAKRRFWINRIREMSKKTRTIIPPFVATLKRI
jgi:hypothetical protein